MNLLRQKQDSSTSKMNTETSVYDEQSSITHFENVSNEVIYEILEYLDYCHTYDAFYNLNIRFRQLFINSPVSFKVNLSYLPKMTFEDYCRRILTFNNYQIKSLSISGQIIIDHFLLMFRLDSLSFTRLEALTLYKISSDKLQSVLIDLASLPRLFSLTITTVGIVQKTDIIHRLIFALPALHYCNIALDWQAARFPLPMSFTEKSSIEHLVVDNPYTLDNFSTLLSYVPQLVRLSCYKLSTMENIQQETSITLSNLTYLHLNLSIPFHQFQKLISNLYHQLEVLRISSMPLSTNISATGWDDDADQVNIDYLYANQWQDLILNHMPRLHTFNFQCFGKIDDNNLTDQSYDILLSAFNSRFWVERVWFFAHQYYVYDDSTWLIFYSIHSLTLETKNPDEYLENEARLQHGKKTIESIRHIVSSDPSMAINYSYRHSHDARLTLLGTLYKKSSSFVRDLCRMIPFIWITELVLICGSFRMDQLIELLRRTLNLQLLTLLPTSRCPLSEDETLHLINSENHEEMPSRGQMTLKHVQAVVGVCFHLKSLEICINENYLELIVRFLLLRNTSKTQQLCLLGLRDAHYGMIRRLHKMIDVEKLTEHYTIEHISNTVYLWW